MARAWSASAGLVPMLALRRTGGWSLLLSVLPFTLYPLFADAKWLGPFRGTEIDARTGNLLSRAVEQSLLGIPIQAFADTVIGFLVFGTALMMTGAGKFFINIAFALCGTFRGGAAKVCIFASGLLGMMSGSIISNVLTAGTMTIPVMVPAVSTLEIIEPDIMPSRPEAKMETFAAPPRKRAAQRKGDVDEEFPAPVMISAVPNTRKPITVSAKAWTGCRAGFRPTGDRSCLFERRLSAAERSQPFGVGEQGINRKGSS